MSNDTKPSMIAPLGGVVVGVCVFLGANFTAGRAIVPTVENVNNPSHGLSPVTYPTEEVQAAGAEATGGVYATVCQTCHQADGNGVKGAFPPLAGSEWVTQDPETPIRIVLLGLQGEITVKGETINAMMPPPPGLSDEQVAEAVSFVRTNFGNSAGEVDVELVKKVKADLGGRTNPWTAAELSALRPAAGAAPAEAGEGEEAEEAAAEGDAEGAEAPAAAEGEAAEAAEAEPAGEAQPAAEQEAAE
jgi:mono/diheme cytochrome c family protein